MRILSTYIVPRRKRGQLKPSNTFFFVCDTLGATAKLNKMDNTQVRRTVGFLGYKSIYNSDNQQRLVKNEKQTLS